MYVKYGTYSHQIGQDSIFYTREPLYSQWRGYRYAEKVTIIAQGALGMDATKTLSQEIDAFITAYSTNYKTFGLYTDAGVATQHVLDSTDANLVDGPKVVVRKWPKGDRGEYACKREYMIEVSAIYTNTETADPWPLIIRYQEKMRYIGNGGVDTRYLYDQDGNEHIQYVRWRTPVLLVQSGVSIGWNGYVLPLGPVEPGRVINPQQEDNFGDITFANGNTKEYHYQWSYLMSLPPGTHLAYTPVSR